MAKFNDGDSFASIRTKINNISDAVDALAGADTLALGELSTDAYRGDRGKTAYDHSQAAHAPADANNYVHPANHAPAVISQDSSNRFVTDAEKSTWNSKSNLALGATSGTAYRGDNGTTAYNHSQSAHAPSDANNYVHPANHAPAIISQDSSNRFVTDAEKSTWNSKSNLELGATSLTAYRGDYGTTAYDHSQVAHAPSNAQKNSDITKAEIEAKLTGTISTHSHTGGTGTSDVTQVINVANPPVALGLTAMVGGGLDSTAGWNSIMTYAADNPGCVLRFPWDPLGFKLSMSPILTGIPSNTQLVAEGYCKLFTTSSALYNVMIPLNNNVSNITIDGLTFDQWGDSALTPNSGASQGCHMIWGRNFNNVKVNNCTFWSYGVTALLFQPDDSVNYGDKLEAVNNTFHWKRKTNTTYDVSVCHLDAKRVLCERNKVFAYKDGAVTDWKPESAYEVHFPSGVFRNNETWDCKNGVLHVNWPISYSSYTATDSSVQIINNSFNRVLRGVYLWGQHTLSGQPLKTRNLLIGGNYTNLRLDATYKPVCGVGMSDGSIDASYFQKVIIANNLFELTVADAATYTDGTTPYTDVGCISMVSNNSFEDVLITGNTFENMPYSGINCVALQTRGPNLHKNIKVVDNTFIDCAYVYPNLSVWGALVNVQYVTGFEFKRNKIKLGANAKNPKELLHVGTNVIGFEWSDNKLELSTNGYYVYYDDLTTFNSIKTDLEVLRCAGTLAMPGSNIRYTTTPAVPTGNYAVGDIIEYAGDLGVVRALCTQKGTSRTLGAQYATWSNSHQHYINVAAQFIPGDVVVFNGGQIGTVMRSSGNYIYTVEPITSYTAGTCTIATPVFSSLLTTQVVDITHPPVGYVACVGDDSTDNTVAFGALLTYATTNKCSLYAPDGIYQMNEWTLTGRKSVVIQGQSSTGAVLKLRNGRNSIFVSLAGADDVSDGCGLLNICLDGNAANNNSAIWDILKITSVNKSCQFSNVYIKNGGNGLVTGSGSYVSGTNQISFSTTTITTTGADFPNFNIGETITITYCTVNTSNNKSAVLVSKTAKTLTFAAATFTSGAETAAITIKGSFVWQYLFSDFKIMFMSGVGLIADGSDNAYSNFVIGPTDLNCVNAAGANLRFDDFKLYGSKTGSGVFVTGSRQQWVNIDCQESYLNGFHIQFGYDIVVTNLNCDNNGFNWAQYTWPTAPVIKTPPDSYGLMLESALNCTVIGYNFSNRNASYKYGIGAYKVWNGAQSGNYASRLIKIQLNDEKNPYGVSVDSSTDGLDLFKPNEGICVEYTTSFTLPAADMGKVIRINSASLVTITLPNEATIAATNFPRRSLETVFELYNTGGMTFAGESGIAIQSITNTFAQQYSVVRVIRTHTDRWSVEGTNQPATAVGTAIGTAAVGTSTKYAREDHVHNITFALGGIGGGTAIPATTGTVTMTMDGTIKNVTPTGAITFNATGAADGHSVTLIVTTSGTTTYNITFGTNFVTTGVLATGSVSAKRFAISFTCSGTTWYETGRTVAM